MGCSAAKNLAVEPISNGKHSNGVDNIRNNITVSTSNIQPIDGADPQVEELENSTLNNLQKGANGMSFEIPLQDNEPTDESIIQKHPPKRLQRLEETQGSPVTLEKLQGKLDEAEIRRQQILQQRVQSAKLTSKIRNQDSLKSASSQRGHEEDVYHLKVPPKEAPHPLNPYEVSYM